MDPYLAQFGGGTPRLPGVDASSFTGIGRGVEIAGEHLDNAARAIQRDKDLDEAAAAGLEFARASTELDKAAIDARLHAGPGAEGHSEAVMKATDERITAALSAISNPRIRQKFEGEFTELRGRIESREYGWAAERKVERTIQMFDDAGTVIANGQAVNPTAEGLAEAITSAETRWTSADLDADTTLKGIKADQRKAAVAWGNAMQLKDPAGLQSVLEKGELNAYLQPEDIDRLRSGAMVEQRRADAAAKAEAAAGKADALERIRVVKAKVADGVDVPDAVLDALDKEAKTYSLDVEAWNLSTIRYDRDFNKETKGWTPAQWEAEYNALAAKGDKRTQTEDVRFNRVAARRGAAVQQFINDPFAAAANAGRPAPAVDWAHPDRAAIEARVTWARGWAAATGMQQPSYLSPEELRQFREQARDPAGKIVTAVQLRSMFGVKDGSAIAKQIDPNDRDMQLYVGLPPASAEWVKNGQAALNRNPKLFDQATANQVFAEFRDAIPDEAMRTAVFNAAKAIVAGAGEQNGVIEWTDNEEGFAQSFRSAIHRAAGQVGAGNDRKGGFVNWNGRRAWLPLEIGARDAQTLISRATPEEWARAGADPAAGGSHWYRDPAGKLTRMDAAHVQQFSRYQLGTVRPGVYTLLGPDGAPIVLDRNGRPWTFDIRKLAR